MKLATTHSLHLTYCTNIHPGETWSQVFENLQQYILPLKERLAPTESFGIGLRLSNLASQQLLQADRLSQFQSWLYQHDLYVFTLNGFPYGEFHQQIIKDQVYAPDWTERSRLDYTLNLVTILATLLPPGMEGSISTSPLSYKPWYATRTEREMALKQSCYQLTIVVEKLTQVQATTGKLIHLDLEPEPDGLIENTAEVIDFVQNWLLPIGGAYLADSLSTALTSAETHLLTHIRLCYDICHFAVAYEDPIATFQNLQAAGIQIGKIQISAALKIQMPEQTDSLKRLYEELSHFAESTYLHQVIERDTQGQLYHYRDLTDALKQELRSPRCEWRVHFHVPIFLSKYSIFQSTQTNILATLQALPQYSSCSHLEVETYTWDVLPDELQIDLITSIEREYQFVIGCIDHKSLP
jgi:hypothetical protein